MIFLRDSPFGVVNVLGEFEGVSDWKLYVDLPRMVTSGDRGRYPARRQHLFRR
jgi:hypothetical protein